MKCNLLGNVNLRGGVAPDAYMLTLNEIALIMRWRATCTVVVLRYDLLNYNVEVIWSYELTGDIYHDWAGHKIAINSASVIPGVENQIYAIGGTDRLLLHSTTGAIVNHVSAQASPTACASLIGEDLIVPEGQTLVAYNKNNLNLKWSKAAPINQWIFGPILDNFVPLQNEIDQTASLWDFRTDELWTLPNTYYPTQLVTAPDNSVVISSGGCSVNQILALDLKSDSEKWSIDYYSTRDTSKKSIEGYPSSNYLMISEDGVLFVATTQPSLEAVSIVRGLQLWSIFLPSQPTVLVKKENFIWLSTVGGDVILIDTVSRAIIDSVKIVERPSKTLEEIVGSREILAQPVSILPVSDEVSFGVIVLTHLGSVCYVEFSYSSAV